MIRPAVAADLPGLLALYAQLSPDNAALCEARAGAAWQHMLVSPGLTVFVAEGSGLLAATDARHRKQGLGTAVLHAAIAAAWAAGCYKVMLLTGSTRPETLRFYASAGFLQNKTGFQIRQP